MQQQRPEAAMPRQAAAVEEEDEDEETSSGMVSCNTSIRSTNRNQGLCYHIFQFKGRFKKDTIQTWPAI